jgi:hypothetical protein
MWTELFDVVDDFWYSGGRRLIAILVAEILLGSFELFLLVSGSASLLVGGIAFGVIAVCTISVVTASWPSIAHIVRNLTHVIRANRSHSHAG